MSIKTALMVSQVFFATPYNYDQDERSNLGAIACPEPSLTVQASKDECDINEIVRRFGLTGELPYGVAVPEYADFTNIPNDYHSAMNFILAADDTFMQMPADVRTRFNNDAGLFLDFVNDSANYDEAVKLGLVIKPPVVAEGETAVQQPEGASAQ